MSSEKAQKWINLASSVSSYVKDGWENIFTNLGVAGKDKRTGMIAKYKPLTEKESEDLHDCDDIADRVVNLIPTEGTRDWIETKLGDDQDKQNENLVLKMKDLDMQSKIAKAWSYSRLYKGSAIFLAVDDGLPLEEPLNINRIVRLNSLTVLSSYELQAQDVNRDILNKNFGLPENYIISPRAGESVEMVHHSRLVRFEGAKVSQNAFITNDYWGDSILTRLFNVLRNFNSSHDSAASILQDFNTGILKLQNLAALVEGDEDDAIVARMRLMNLSKSILGVVLLDADSETYENKTVPLANLDKVLDKVNERLVSATGMPHNKILGMGPKTSLSGGGESEEKDWLTSVANQQELVIKKPIDKILEIILFSKQGPTNGKIPDGWSWEFRPLWQPSQKDTTETRNKQSQTDKNYFEMGALTATQIAKDAFSTGEYSFERSVDLKEIEEQEKANKIEAERAAQIIKTGVDPNDNKGANNKKAITDIIEQFEDEGNGHMHLGSLSGMTGGPIDWGTDKDGIKTHVHKLPNGNLTAPAPTGVEHKHATFHGETGPVIPKKENDK